MQTIKLDLNGRPYKREKTYTYYGHLIHYNGGPGYALPYSAYIDGLFKCADTLARIKKLIREYINK